MQDENQKDLEESLGFAQIYNGGFFNKKVKILDSTLREGEQAPGISFTKRQRLQIGWMLDYFGVNAIEISPIVSDSHFESCKELVKAKLSATIVAHGRALKEDIDVALRCDASFYAMYHSVSDIHLQYKLNVSREEALNRTLTALDYAKSHGLQVRVTLEDASRADPTYLRDFAKSLYEANVDRISVPDTVGAMKPSGMYRLVKSVKEVAPVPIDVHCHNDMGLSLANALAGYEAGADQVHTTIGGLGERTGITDLSQFVLALYVLYGVKLDVRYEMLNDVYKILEEYIDYKIPSNQPIMGENAYKHKAGTHIAAILNNPMAYELVSPEFLGKKRKIVFSELIGKNGASFLLKVLGVDNDEALAREVARGVKSLQMGDLFELELNDEIKQRILASGERR
ncbi:MAG: homocitrate synthase/isopropylmalate synthase family protein [Nitrososphaeria archaeon]|nr:hypothetical protein [Conexivisphaerales archaeon]